MLVVTVVHNRNLCSSIVNVGAVAHAMAERCVRKRGPHEEGGYTKGHQHKALAVYIDKLVPVYFAGRACACACEHSEAWSRDVTGVAEARHRTVSQIRTGRLAFNLPPAPLHGGTPAPATKAAAQPEPPARGGGKV